MNFIPTTLTEHLPDLIMMLSMDGIILYTNPAFTLHLLYAAEEIKGKDYQELLHPTLQDDRINLADQVLTKTSVSGMVHQLKRKDGTEAIVNWSSVYLQNENILFCTGRMEKEQQHTQQEHLFEALVENTFDLLAVTNEKGIWTYVSESLAKLIGSTRELLIGQYCFDYMHPADLPQLAEQQQALLQGQKKIQGSPYRFRNAAGEWMWMEAIITNQLANPDIKGIIITGRDISDRMAAEKNAKEIKLLEGLREGEEKERGRIARDLHDEISSMIVAAKMHIGILTKTIPHIADNHAYQKGLNLLDEAASQIRRTSHNLMPEILLENGLHKALNWYCSSISNSHLKLQYISLGSATRYSPTFELSLYRIVQELINNIIRHARATEAIIQISYLSNSLMLTIEDNGIGFNKMSQAKGTGLSSITKRAAVMNGVIEIQSTPGKGTSIYLQFQTEGL